MIYVSTNYKVNLLHGATLAGVDSGFSTFCLSWESQGLRAWASPPESLHPIPTRSPKSTYIYLSHSPNDCHSPTASEKQEKTLRGRERMFWRCFFSLFLVIWSIRSEHFDSDPCFMCEGLLRKCLVATSPGGLEALQWIDVSRPGHGSSRCVVAPASPRCRCRAVWARNLRAWQRRWFNGWNMETWIHLHTI